MLHGANTGALHQANWPNSADISRFEPVVPATQKSDTRAATPNLKSVSRYGEGVNGWVQRAVGQFESLPENLSPYELGRLFEGQATSESGTLGTLVFTSVATAVLFVPKRPILLSPQDPKATKIGSKLLPNGERLYSTFGGTWG